MKRVLVWLTVLAGCCVAAAAGPPANAASTLCVGGSGCYATLQAAVDAAHDGDTITIAPGTYAGGVTIGVSVKVDGAGPGQTVISGGGPVLTVGTYGASSEPTVSIEGLTITGGVTRSSPESRPFVGEEGVIALGGGVEIPPNADFSGGADVTIANSVITGNRVAPSSTLPFGPPCPSGPCPFAEAAGGGIDSWGTVTLEGTTISNNRVGTASGLSNVASDAYAGAIQNWIGPLTISNSLISDNRASASAPNGRFADSGATFLEGGTLTMNSSTVTDNSATLNAAMPNSVDALAVAGGIHISDQSSGAIINTTVAGNAVTMTNTVGDANAFSGGVHIDNNDLTLRNDAITDNSVTVAALSSSGGNAAGDSGAGELGGSIANTLLTGNSVSASSIAGDATADAGATIFAGSISNSIITNNHLHASSPSGAASDHGGGLISGDAITLRNTKVSGNTTDATGQSGVARGGGIYDVDNSADNGPPGGAAHPDQQQRDGQRAKRQRRDRSPRRGHLRHQSGLPHEQRSRRQRPRPMLRLLSGGRERTRDEPLDSPHGCARALLPHRHSARTRCNSRETNSHRALDARRQEGLTPPHPLDRPARAREQPRRSGRLPRRRQEALGRAQGPVLLRRRRQLPRHLVPQAGHAHVHREGGHL